MNKCIVMWYVFMHQEYPEVFLTLGKWGGDILRGFTSFEHEKSMTAIIAPN